MSLLRSKGTAGLAIASKQRSVPIWKLAGQPTSRRSAPCSMAPGPPHRHLLIPSMPNRQILLPTASRTRPSRRTKRARKRAVSVDFSTAFVADQSRCLQPRWNEVGDGLNDSLSRQRMPRRDAGHRVIYGKCEPRRSCQLDVLASHPPAFFVPPATKRQRRSGDSGRLFLTSGGSDRPGHLADGCQTLRRRKSIWSPTIRPRGRNGRTRS